MDLGNSDCDFENSLRETLRNRCSCWCLLRDSWSSLCSSVSEIWTHLREVIHKVSKNVVLVVTTIWFQLLFNSYSWCNSICSWIKIVPFVIQSLMWIMRDLFLYENVILQSESLNLWHWTSSWCYCEPSKLFETMKLWMNVISLPYLDRYYLCSFYVTSIFVVVVVSSFEKIKLRGKGTMACGMLGVETMTDWLDVFCVTVNMLCCGQYLWFLCVWGVIYPTCARFFFFSCSVS